MSWILLEFGMTLCIVCILLYSTFVIILQDDIWNDFHMFLA